MLFQRFSDEYIEALHKSGLAITYLRDSEQILEKQIESAVSELSDLRGCLTAVQNLRRQYDRVDVEVNANSQ